MMHRENRSFSLLYIPGRVSPLDSKEIKPVNPKGNQPWISIGRTNDKLKLQYFDHLLLRADSLEKTLMLGKIEGRRRGGSRGWDGWMASLTWWTWVWISSGRWWRIDWEAWCAAIHGATKSQTWLSDWTTANDPFLRRTEMRLNKSVPL